MNRNLSTMQFFHGTVSELKPGSVVSPAGKGKYHGVGSPDHAYATDSPGSAWHYAELSHDWEVNRRDRGPFPIPRVYQVEPVGHHEEDPNQHFSGDVRSTEGFRVVGEHDVSDLRGDPEDWRF